MTSVFVYVVDRDFGFAPNPFHGLCTLATCKPRIRRSAALGDWVIGLGGGRLNASGRCIFAMIVTGHETFDAYWEKYEYLPKRPVRNGSLKMMVGDNIYHRDDKTRHWVQADSHHSHPDGTVNEVNMANDTRVDRVLVSRHFYYFGRLAPDVPRPILDSLGYRNGRNHRRFAYNKAAPLIQWLELSYGENRNRVVGDPFDFMAGARRYSKAGNKVV